MQRCIRLARLKGGGNLFRARGLPHLYFRALFIGE